MFVAMLVARSRCILRIWLLLQEAFGEFIGWISWILTGDDIGRNRLLNLSQLLFVLVGERFFNLVIFIVLFIHLFIFHVFILNTRFSDIVSYSVLRESVLYNFSHFLFLLWQFSPLLFDPVNAASALVLLNECFSSRIFDL